MAQGDEAPKPTCGLDCTYETSNQVDKKLKINNATKPTTTWVPNLHGCAATTGGGRDDFDSDVACAGGDGGDGGGVRITYGRGRGLGECTAGRRS